MERKQVHFFTDKMHFKMQIFDKRPIENERISQTTRNCSSAFHFVVVLFGVFGEKYFNVIFVSNYRLLFSNFFSFVHSFLLLLFIGVLFIGPFQPTLVYIVLLLWNRFENVGEWWKIKATEPAQRLDLWLATLHRDSYTKVLQSTTDRDEKQKKTLKTTTTTTTNKHSNRMEKRKSVALWLASWLAGHLTSPTWNCLPIVQISQEYKKPPIEQHWCK